MQLAVGDYAHRLRLCPQEQSLLLLAALTLIDGVFISAVIGGVLAGPADAVSLGVNIFSGAGCLAVALALEGALSYRLGAVLRVYGLYVLPGTVLIMLCLPFLHGLLLPHFEIFSALVLGGLALELLGVQVAPRGPRPSAWVAQWTWSLRLAATPQIVLAVGLSSSLVYAAQASPALGNAASMNDIGLAVLAVASGMALTLVGAVFGSALQRLLIANWVRRAGAVGLGLIAVRILGGPVPEGAPLVALVIGLSASVIWRAMERRRESLPDVSQTSEGEN